MIPLWTSSSDTTTTTNSRNSSRRRRRRKRKDAGAAPLPASFETSTKPLIRLLVPALLLTTIVLVWMQIQVEESHNNTDHNKDGPIVLFGQQPTKQREPTIKQQQHQLRGGGGGGGTSSFETDAVSKNQHHHQQQHVIPNILIFTHSVNLLNSTSLRGEEDIALQRNVFNTIHMHPDSQARFLTDDDCVDSLQRVLGQNTPLVDFFRNETRGMYKADVCRGAALYETGGLYFDVDIETRMNLFSVISANTTFVTILVHKDSKYPHNFFQAFIGATPKNPILWRYLELFLKYYQGKMDIQGPLGVLLLRKAHDDVVLHHNKHHGSKEEKSSSESEQVVELWQEVLYRRELFPNVPPPVWGTRRACHFVVVSDNLKTHKRPPFTVPLYSRTAGSRMCGGKDSHH